jgi:hypothetical protein
MKSLMLGVILAGNEWAEVGECNKSRLYYTNLQSSYSHEGWKHLYVVERDWTGSWYLDKENTLFVWKEGTNNKYIRFGILEGEEIEPSYVCSFSNTMMEISKKSDCFTTTVWQKCPSRK